MVTRTGTRSGWGAIAAFVALAAAPAASAEEGGAVHIRVIGLERTQGTVRCALFASADGFPSKSAKALKLATSGIKGTQAVCTFEGVPPGTYAVAAFHDEDADGELDTSVLGIPQEGIAASNDAKGTFGPPSFEDAAIRVGPGGFEQTIRVDY